MIESLRRLCAIGLTALVLGGPAAAQSVSSGDLTPELFAVETVTDPNLSAISDPAGLEAYVSEYELWEGVANRAETLVGSGLGSNFALTRLRSELVDWRQRFADVSSVNAERIDTVSRQLSALGPEPEGGELATLAERRATLTEQIAQLRTPRLLAAEAYARADGLIGEIDSILRNRQAMEITSRGAAPINPASWLPAYISLQDGIKALVLESTSVIASRLESGRISEGLPQAFMLLVIGMTLLIRGRIWSEKVWAFFAERAGKWNSLLHAVITATAIAVPYFGLTLLALGLSASNLFGYRGLQVIDHLPLAGAYVLVGRWMSFQFFSQGRFKSPIHFSRDEQKRARRLVKNLGWVLAAGAMVFTLIGSVEESSLEGAVLAFPLVLLLGWVLFWVGHLLYQHRTKASDDSAALKAFVEFVGRLTILAAIMGPILAAVGFSAAYRVLLVPTTKSLAVLGVLMVIHGLAVELYHSFSAAGDHETDPRDEGLASVLFALALGIVAVPFYALIWGATRDDLLEIWTRFGEGFAVGESTISPTDLLTFILVFSVGYTLTRVVQNMLRVTILPKTRIDIGGRNAVISGVGYLGVFLAAIVAITSAGIDLSSLAIVAGALSVGIGFGLQNIVSNFVSGIILLIERPISEGDLIEVGTQAGYVRSISVRSTRIETFDRTDVIVPNADLVTTQVTNWTRGSSVGRVIVPVGVAYGSDIDLVTKILHEVAEGHPMVVQDTDPKVMFMGFGADSLDFQIRAIIRDVNFKLQTQSDMNHEIAKRFAEAGIEIPFAQRDIWIRNAEALYPPALRSQTGADDA